MIVVDQFAGAGGWDIAADSMGLDVIGIELDGPACQTRRAAWLNTVRGDVSALDPFDYCPIRGLISSPPCQAFSNAGDGLGRAAIGAYLTAVGRMRDGEPLDRARLDAACQDQRAHLVLEPLRWALAARPEWVALEQVPPVLPIWEAIAAALRAIGYSAWCGNLSAEQYGVAQTRERAILIASRVRRVDRPPATHARYVAPRRCDETSLSLFDAPEPGRIVLPEDRELRPWVSMADALGWPPGDLAGFPRRDDDGGDGYRERDLREASEPAFALIEKARSWQRWQLRGPGAFRGTVRQMNEPAPTMTAHPGRHGVGWELRAGTGEHEASRPADAPAPTLRFGARLNMVAWVTEADAIRLTETEAAILQSFPPGYPWQGTKTQRFRQIGNAIPPLLARAVLEAVA